jgi:quinol monooxygenase YgiN
MPVLRFLALFIGLIAGGAQADSPVFTVAYVEIMPSARTTAVAAFKQYRDASRKDDSFTRFDLFEQVGQPGRFVIVERWPNAKASEAHAATPHAKDYRATLDSIRLSDYDQRPYKPLSLGPSPAAIARSVYVVSHIDIGGQGTNAPDLLRRLAEESRKQDGNLCFDVLQHNVRANHFTVIEGWQNQRALAAHIAASSTREFRNTVGPLTGSPLDQRIYKVVE